eukprot:COSAG05_NODE_5766_length_1093_cov_1.065392_2_plen_87_part_01
MRLDKHMGSLSALLRWNSLVLGDLVHDGLLLARRPRRPRPPAIMPVASWRRSAAILPTVVGLLALTLHAAATTASKKEVLIVYYSHS